ncbi:hypothetical protein CDAR_86091 [Caerostris darwini]|uniref:Uncharacterized protein n=1 Tax=Caerostris darwini TaxID=1538125 RepID=A0AAV4SIJ2_9ARAC|nr:hypothetical protein CDAR_86091 [Caerostris darwini]
MPKRKPTESERIESKRRKIEVMRLYRKSDNVKAHDRERKRIARSKPETRARQNALQRERRALKRQQAINPHDDNIKHTKCVQTPSLYSPSCSCPLKGTFNSSSSVTPSCSHCFRNNTHSDLNDYSHEKQWLKVEERFFKSIADGPTNRCYCCDCLYMKKNSASYSKADLRARGFTEEQIAIIFSADLDEADFCKMCSDHIRKRNFFFF